MNHGSNWSNIIKYCINYVKGCQECHQYGPIQYLSSNEPCHDLIFDNTNWSNKKNERK